MTDLATFNENKRKVLARIAAAKALYPEPAHVAMHNRSLTRGSMKWLKLWSGGERQADEKHGGRVGGGAGTRQHRANRLGGLQVTGEATQRGEF